MIATRILSATVVLLLAASPTAAQNEIALDTVRGLYASAEYEQALTAITELAADQEPADRIDLELYRVLCLTALGRSAEAAGVIEAIVSADPLYQPGAEAAPRIRAAFSAARRRLSPALARTLYGQGKAAFDRKAFNEAAGLLERALGVMDHPDVRDVAALNDLRTLATGFLELSRTSLTNARASTASAESAAGEASVLPAAAVGAAAASAYTDAMPLRQDMPKWSNAVAGTLFDAEFSGTIEIEIDELGAVVEARVVDSIHPLYDRLLLDAARRWTYEPARRLGQPVKSRKRVDVRLRPR